MVQKKTKQKSPRPKAKPKTKAGAVSSASRKPRRPVDMEVEVKVPCDDLATLTEAGATLELVEERHFEDNWVYKLPDGKLRKGQYLRVRYVGDGDGAGKRKEGLLTYKGKSRRETAASKGKSKGKKVREEIETTVGQPEKVAKIFKRLGLVRSFRYQKYRTVYRMTLDDEQTLLAMFDETPIGNFLELEGESAVIEAAAARLGVPESDFLQESYVELQVARCAAKGEPLSDMVFEAEQKKALKKPAKKKK